MHSSRRRGALVAFAVAALAASTFQVGSAVAAAPAPAAPSRCGPLDVAFVIDDTGSMGGAITNLKSGINTIINDVQVNSGGDYQLGLITFKDNVTVKNNLAPGNAGPVTTSVNALAASGGGNEPEASDESVNTAVNSLPAASRPQVGNFGGWRATATKFVVLVTDARPGGFDDTYTAADAANAATYANNAVTNGIKISAVYVPTSTTYSPQITPVMQNYATTTGGQYTQAAANGTGVATAIQEFLRNCKRTDVFIKDTAGDNGTEPSTNPVLWASPDIKVCPTTADCGVNGITPAGGQNVYIHVRLNNNGPYGSGPGTGSVKLYFANASGSIPWQSAWTYIGQQTLTVPAGVTVAKIPWNNVPGPGHFCLVARWVSATDPMSVAETTDIGLNTANNNNIAWRNYIITHTVPTKPVKSWFTLGNGTGRTIKGDLVFRGGEKPLQATGGRLVVDLGPKLFDLWRQGGAQADGVKQVGETSVEIADPRQSALHGLLINPDDQYQVELTFTPGAQTEPGAYVTTVQQYSEGRDIGGVAYEVNVEKG
ncbi:vWA domain-containing protein [Actinosynnema sp. NPDC020468]|uniref:vWA domain-containing protein n=1 Tax=Actinosynnema sp. NPDC020468 TaxID=3154488 RepID=UPI0033EAD555